MKYSTKKRRVIKSKTSKILKGGKYLGEGSFGCVITPALSCDARPSRKHSTSIRKRGLTSSKNRTNTGTRTTTSTKTVSKIIMYPDDGITDEINISKKLKQIDPHQNYFITIDTICKIKSIPSDRSNIAKVRFTNDTGETFQKLEKKELDEDYCPVDLANEPMNLIMPNAGFSLVDIAYYIRRVKKNKDVSKFDSSIVKTVNELFKNIKPALKNLLIGLLKMHQNRIVHRDVKEENITAIYNEKTRSVDVRYIDFGLAEVLTPEFTSYYYNINSNGTKELVAPEIFVSHIFYKYRDNSDIYIKYKINGKISDYVKKIHKELNLSTSNIKPVAEKLFKDVKTAYSNKTLLKNYFGTNENKLNGYLQKNDIYGLGLSIYEFLHIRCGYDVHKNPKLYDLLKRMMELDPDKRLNALQCIQHPYFS